MASFQSKIGRKRPRKSKNKNYRSVSFLHSAKQIIKKKIAKKFKKLKNTLWIRIKSKQVAKGLERAKIKIIVPFLPDAKQKFSKEQQKNSEN